MDDAEIHSRAIKKLRAKLFEEHSIEDYGIKPNSENVIELIRTRLISQAPSLGGLSYEVAHPKFTRIEIKHSRGDTFTLYAIGKISGSTLEITFHSVSTTFNKLPATIINLLKAE